MAARLVQQQQRWRRRRQQQQRVHLTHVPWLRAHGELLL
jgi:hypothetical protein